MSPRPTRLDVVSDLMLYKTRSFYLTGCESGPRPTRIEVFMETPSLTEQPFVEVANMQVCQTSKFCGLRTGALSVVLKI